MLDYGRQRAVEALRIPQTAVLVTSGPAGVQVSEYSCEAINLELYLLVPKTSDHLFNLEHDPAVTLLAAGWELRGEARIFPPGATSPDLQLLQLPGAEWCLLLHVEPFQVQIRREGGWGNLETIDLKVRPA